MFEDLLYKSGYFRQNYTKTYVSFGAGSSKRFGHAADTHHAQNAVTLADNFIRGYTKQQNLHNTELFHITIICHLAGLLQITNKIR